MNRINTVEHIISPYYSVSEILSLLCGTRTEGKRGKHTHTHTHTHTERERERELTGMIPLMACWPGC